VCRGMHVRTDLDAGSTKGMNWHGYQLHARHDMQLPWTSAYSICVFWSAEPY
jgi:hypothetical protein